MKKEIAEIVLERAGSYCEACGGVGGNFALHHRKLRSQGGKDEPCNLIAVHHSCHNLATDSIHLNPAKSVKKGWIVPSWGDPHEFPLHLPDGSVVRLDNEGNYLDTEEGENGNDRDYG
jgi:hypothetical protein